MSKKFIITEEERNNIKSLYNVREQFDMETIIQGLMKKLENNFEDDETSIDSSENQQSQESDDLTNISEKGQKLLDNQTFQKKLDDISKSINIDKDSIIKLMNHESKLDPQVKNSIGCVGLIQFCPDSKGGSTKTINGKQYDLSQLRNDLSLQMDAIENFWVGGKKQGKIKECGDLQIYNFFPVAAGKPDNYVLQTKGLSAEKIANQNPIFNRTLGRDRNTPLTVGDIKQYQEKTGIA